MGRDEDIGYLIVYEPILPLQGNIDKASVLILI